MMTIYIFVIIIIIVQCVIAHPPGPPPIPPQICKNYVGDTMRGGACFSTNLNSLTQVIQTEDTKFDDPEIKEWHFHVYWFQQNKYQNESAMRIQKELIEKVRTKAFTVVLPGITSEILPKLNMSNNIPTFNDGPRGPHPVGNFEVWTPKESFADVLSFFMLRRGELSILLHPLTPHTVQDHSGRAMWLGKSFSLDLTVLCEGCHKDESQYPELGLGYSGKN